MRRANASALALVNVQNTGLTDDVLLRPRRKIAPHTGTSVAAAALHLQIETPAQQPLIQEPTAVAARSHHAVHCPTMLRRVVPALAALLLLPTNALARSAPSEAARARSFPAPPIRARAAVVMDASNGRVLVSFNAHQHLPIASTTKMMTALVALQYGHMSDRITVPKSAFDYESDATVMGLRPGQIVTLRDLLYGLMLPSGADAANTIAIHYGGSEPGFATLMNREAALLGLRDTHFVNAHGLTAKNNFSSAYDLAVLGQYISYLPDLQKIVSARTYSWNGRTLTNLNHVLFWYPGVDGLKPGYTNEAGICQVLDARLHGKHIVAAILNTPNLVTDARNLLNFGLRDFSWKQSALPGDSPSVSQSGTTGKKYMYFPATGHYVRGKMLDAFAANGGAAILGFPRTESLAEGVSQVQYFQNGALSLNSAQGRVSRLPLGLTPLPQISSSGITASPSPVVIAGTPTIAHLGTKTGHRDRARSAATSRTAKPRSTPTRTALPPPPPRGTAAPPGTIATNSVFQSFVRAHHDFLGSALSPSRRTRGYVVQIFAYGALAYDAKRKSVMLLPIGDRLLAARHYLPPHPGNVYPATFASPSVLATLRWLPSTPS
ncbi:MAG: serine hydrolase [Chloroflexota bacterium]